MSGCKQKCVDCFRGIANFGEEKTKKVSPGPDIKRIGLTTHQGGALVEDPLFATSLGAPAFEPFVMGFALAGCRREPRKAF